jgi:hypothetical protein
MCDEAKQVRDFLGDFNRQNLVSLPIQCVRVSSAQAMGSAKQYSYWGAVRYEIRRNKKGQLTFIAQERASSDRRSYRLAEKDAEEIANSENRLFLDLNPGPLPGIIIKELGLEHLTCCPILENKEW